MVAVTIEAGWRALRKVPPGSWSERLTSVALLAVVVASAGGLGILLGGGAPADTLHFVYAVIAIAALPVASSLTRTARPRIAGVVQLLVALAALIIILRLFQTG